MDGLWFLTISHGPAHHETIREASSLETGMNGKDTTQTVAIIRLKNYESSLWKYCGSGLGRPIASRRGPGSRHRASEQPVMEDALSPTLYRVRQT